MPQRYLREGILDSEAVNSLSEEAEILYRRLMSVADDYGRFDANTEQIQHRCFWRQLKRWPCERIERALMETSKVFISPGTPLVQVYLDTKGKRVLQINNFGRPRSQTSRYDPPPPVCEQVNTDDSRRMQVNACESISYTSTYTYNSSFLEKWNEFKANYPPARLDEERACQALLSREKEADNILAGLRRALLSADWKKDSGKYVQWASRFIQNGLYKNPWPPAEPPSNKPRPLTDAEIFKKVS